MGGVSELPNTGNSSIMDDEPVTPRVNNVEEISLERVEAVYKYNNS